MNGYMNWICKAGKIRNGKNQSNVIHRVSIICPRQVLDQVLYDSKLAWTPCSLSRELQLIYTKLFQQTSTLKSFASLQALLLQQALLARGFEAEELKIPSLILAPAPLPPSLHTITTIFSFSYFSEDLVLAEERTTEKDRKRIMEGKIAQFKCQQSTHTHTRNLQLHLSFQHDERLPKGSDGSKQRKKNQPVGVHFSVHTFGVILFGFRFNGGLNGTEAENERLGS